MKKNTLIKISAFVLILSTLIVLSINSILASDSYQIDSNMNSMMDEVAEMQSTRVESALSSNPYDYIKNNDYYNKIVSLGTDALDLIKQKIDESNENGLKEYILAAAANDIAKVDLKKDTFNWSNGKEWVNEWDKHLRNIPDEVDKISSSKEKSADEKNKALTQLGVAAIPYILDKIEAGDASLSNSIDNLLEGNSKFDAKKEKVTDYVAWAKDNKTKFESIRSLVEKVRK